jgi:hypothetical protein
MACKYAEINIVSVHCIKGKVKFPCLHCRINASANESNYGELQHIKFNANGQCSDYEEGEKHYLEIHGF